MIEVFKLGVYSRHLWGGFTNFQATSVNRFKNSYDRYLAKGMEV